MWRGFCRKLTGKQLKFTNSGGEDRPNPRRAGYKQMHFRLAENSGSEARARGSGNADLPGPD
jgi:hypothetical protein